MRRAQNLFMLTHQVAAFLGLTPDTVRAMERQGKLTAVRVGRVRLFKRGEVERLAEQRATRTRTTRP